MLILANEKAPLFGLLALLLRSFRLASFVGAQTTIKTENLTIRSVNNHQAGNRSLCGSRSNVPNADRARVFTQFRAYLATAGKFIDYIVIRQGTNRIHRRGVRLSKPTLATEGDIDGATKTINDQKAEQTKTQSA